MTPARATQILSDPALVTTGPLNSNPDLRVRLRHHFCWLLPLLLAACSAPVTKPDATDPTPDPLAAAEAALTAGNWLDAARRFEQLALQPQHAPPAAGALRLQAAEAFAHAGDYLSLQRLLLPLEPADLTLDQRLQRQILLALPLQRDPVALLAALAKPAAISADATLLARFHGLRADARIQQGERLAAARELQSQISYLAADSELTRDRQRQLWRQLQQMPEQQLQQAVAAPSERSDEAITLHGWLNLALLQRRSGGDDELLALQLLGWLRDYPTHPARQQPPAELQHHLGGAVGRHHLVVLLPLSGRYQRAGVALRDGILAGYYATPIAERPLLTLLDTAADPSRIADLYALAAAQQATLLLGPLDKDVVAQLRTLPQRTIPVIALNEYGAAGSDSFYQFSLAPEAEARQVAERARLAGYRRALALVPEGEWGERLLQAFVDHWQRLGGTLLESATYSAQESDFAKPIKALLNLDDSEARRSTLIRQLGERPQFEPRRREDAELIFLAAYPSQARLLQPQIRFHHAAGLPIYATSHLYSGQPDPDRDRDMDGIRFADMPWTLQQTSQAGDVPLLSRHPGSLQRLVAFGVDAWRLGLQLDRRGQLLPQPLAGSTGELSLPPGAFTVVRRLNWSQFVRGVPKPLPPLLPQPEVVEEPAALVAPPPTTTQ